MLSLNDKTRSIHGECIFDKENHKYFNHENIEVPAISNLLKHFGILDDRFYKPGSAQKGTYIHAAIELYLNGTLENYSIDPIALPYLEQFKKWKELSNFEPKYTETHLIHNLGFGVTPDWIGTMNNKLILVEGKTGGVSKWIKLQIAAQKMAIEEVLKEKIDQCYYLQLKPDGFVFRDIPSQESNENASEVEALVKAFWVQKKYGVKVGGHYDSTVEH